MSSGLGQGSRLYRYLIATVGGRYKVLTVVMVIFVLLTILAGIYDMSFENRPRHCWKS